MSVIAVIGSGATTTAVGLAAAWPIGERALLAELDPAGGCLSAWLDVPRQPNLSDLAASPGARSWPTAESMFQLSPSGLEVLVAPVRAVEAAAAVLAASSTVVPLLAALRQPVVIVDGGRLTNSLSPVLTAAGVVAVMHRQHPGSAAAATVAIERLADQCDGLRLRSIPFVLGLIGDHPYPVDEVAAFVGAGAATLVPIDHWAAAVLAGRAGSASRLRRSPLMRSLGAMAQLLSITLRDSGAELAWTGSMLAGEPGPASSDSSEGARHG